MGGRQNAAGARQLGRPVGSDDGPGVHRFVGVQLGAVAQQHLPQRGQAPQPAPRLDGLHGLGLPDRAVATGETAPLDDAQRLAIDSGTNLG